MHYHLVKAVMKKAFYSDAVQHRGYVFDAFPKLLENEFHYFPPKYIIRLIMDDEEDKAQDKANFAFPDIIEENATKKELYESLRKILISSQESHPKLFSESELIHELVEEAKVHKTYIEVNANQNVPDIFNTICMHLNNISAVSFPVRISVPEDIQGEEKRLQYVLDQGQAKGLRLSHWKKICPVKYNDEDVVEEGTINHSVVYRVSHRILLLLPRFKNQ